MKVLSLLLRRLMYVIVKKIREYGYLNFSVYVLKLIIVFFAGIGFGFISEKILMFFSK